MFPLRYFANKFFASRYWPNAGHPSAPPVGQMWVDEIQTNFSGVEEIQF
jgi:hypothetical protein